MKLSILICTLPERKEMFDNLVDSLHKQDNGGFEIIRSISVTKSIGEKRNELLNIAHGEYVAFIDDDDRISDNYIDLLIEGIEKGVDCCSLKGVYTVDGRNPEVFEHSLKYKEWKTTENEIKYERYPNHLNCIKASIAKQFKFPEINHGEDHKWSEAIHRSGLIKTEFTIPETIYFYNKISKK